MLSSDVADATSAYFVVALITVLVCMSCYRLLMTLPCSQHIKGASDLEKFQPLLNSPPPFQSPTMMGAFTPLPMTPTGSTGMVFDSADAVEVSLDSRSYETKPVMKGAAAEPTSFSHVMPLVWKNQLTVFANLFLTTLCYPGIITSIPCRQFLGLRKDSWFQTLLLTSFTFADILARFFISCGFKCGLSYRNIHLTVLIRALIFPVMLYCVQGWSALPWSTPSDGFSFFVVACFGFLNGYCVSLALIVVNEIPDLSNEQKLTSGRITACSVNSGLCLGSIAAASVASILGFS
jgi:hypothetical protein